MIILEKVCKGSPFNITYYVDSPYRKKVIHDSESAEYKTTAFIRSQLHISSAQNDPEQHRIGQNSFPNESTQYIFNFFKKKHIIPIFSPCSEFMVAHTETRTIKNVVFNSMTRKCNNFKDIIDIVSNSFNGRELFFIYDIAYIVPFDNKSKKWYPNSNCYYLIRYYSHKKYYKYMQYKFRLI